MLNALIQVARGLLAVGVLAFVVIGAVGGSGMNRGPDKVLGSVIGALVGFLIASLVFGLAAAILDMQRSLRILADAHRRQTRQDASLAPHSTRKEPPSLR